jgi:transposase-like protein
LRRRSNEDKARAVIAALRLRPRESDRAIADHVGVSYQTVANHRKRLSNFGSQSEVRTGRDGRTINTANIGKSVNFTDLAIAPSALYLLASERLRVYPHP